MANTWAQKTDIGERRLEPQFTKYNGKIWLVAGQDTLIDTQQYNPLADTWFGGLAEPPEDVGCVGGEARIDNVNIVALGAASASATTLKLFIYNADTDSWSQGADLILSGSAQRHNTSMAVVDDKIHVVATTNHFVYNPDTNTWDSAASRPQSLGNAGLCEFKGKLHAIAGATTNYHHVYNPTTDSWSEVTPTPSTSTNTEAVSGGGWIWVFFETSGGSNGLWLYDPVQDTYEVKATPPAGVDFLHGLTVTNDTLWAWYGFINRSELWAYEPDVVMEADLGEFTGTDGATINPAPEPLPHVITSQDTGGNTAFQRKLQENFDSIQRQLLALDPDTPISADPVDHS